MSTPLLVRAHVIEWEIEKPSRALWDLLTGGMAYDPPPRRVDIPRARRYPRQPIVRPAAYRSVAEQSRIFSERYSNPSGTHDVQTIKTIKRGAL